VTFIDPPFIGETMPSSYKLYYIPFDEESHSDLFRWWRSTKNSGHRATMCQTSMAQDHPLLRSETPTLLRKVGKRRGKQYNLIAYTRAAA
jgi:site-specific DNA-adenine methylase